MTGSIFRDVKQASSLGVLFFMPLMLFAGFYSNRDNYAVWIGWIEYLSPFKYGFEAFAWN